MSPDPDAVLPVLVVILIDTPSKPASVVEISAAAARAVPFPAKVPKNLPALRLVSAAANFVSY